MNVPRELLKPDKKQLAQHPYRSCLLNGKQVRKAKVSEIIAEVKQKVSRN